MRCLTVDTSAQLQNSCEPPAIAVNPQSVQIDAGESTTFSVTATGTDLKYQWRREGLNITGATFSTYSVIYAEEDDQGSYTVYVYNDCGSIISAIALLVVQGGGGSGGSGGAGDGNLFS